MKTLQSLFLVPLALSIAQVLGHRSLFQFRDMIVCVMPDSWPLFDYTDYGCYCGMGGSGTPVDGLDRCCQVHDCCYSAAQQHPDCQTFFGHPYIKQYYWSCDHDDRRPTCLSKNNICEMFICECDREAAECFGRNTWNPDHKRLPRERCVDNLNMNTCPSTNVYEAMQSYHKA